MPALIIYEDSGSGAECIELMAELVGRLRPAMYHDERRSFAVTPVTESDAIAGNECLALHRRDRNVFSRRASTRTSADRAEIGHPTAVAADLQKKTATRQRRGCFEE